MAKQVLFIQGGGEGTYDEWDDKLVASLREHLSPAYEVRYPRMPESQLEYGAWKTALSEAMAELPADSILVGHSLGGMFLISHLAEDAPPQSIAGVFLLSAPFAGPGGWPNDDDMEPQANLGARLPDGLPVYVYHGTADDTVPPAHVDLYKQSIPYASVRKLNNRDHQLNDDLSEVAADILSLG